MTLVLLLLSALLAGASLVSARAVYGTERRARVLGLVGAAVISQSVIVASVYLLSLVEAVSRWSLAGAVAGGSLALLALVVVKDGGLSPFVANERAHLASLRALPRDLWRACRTSWLPLWPVVVAALVVFSWLAFSIWFSPPPGNNDALFYHEPIVAMTLQEGHFGPYELPRHLQRINGMPRYCHFLHVWFAAFTGRHLVEVPNLLSGPLGALATYALLRRAVAPKGVALAWALCWMLTPGIVRLSFGVMVDAHSAALVMAAVCLTLVPRLTPSRALVAALAIGLTTGTKYHVLVVSFVLALALLFRILARRKEWSPLVLVVSLVGCASVVLAAVAGHYLRNWLIFENPIWPAGVKLPGLGVELKSAMDMKDVATSGKGLASSKVFERWIAGPFNLPAWHGGSAAPEDYGVGGLYIVWPLALVGTALALGKTLYLVVRRRAVSARMRLVFVCAVINAVALYTFPSFVRGRYWLVVIGTYFVVACWLLSAPRVRPLARQIAFTLGALTLASLLWSAPRGWLPSWSAVWKRVGAPAEARDYTARHLSTITPKLGALRAREMTAGKVVGYDKGLYSIGILWNDDYSNVVRYLNSKDPVKLAEDQDVDWLFLHTKTIQNAKARGWQKLGPALKRKGRRGGTVYRRVR